MHRPNLNALPGAERMELAQLIRIYTTPKIVDDHWQAIQSGIHDNPESFLEFHRDYIRGLEEYLKKAGAKWPLLPKWNPAQRIPDEFHIPGSGPGKLQNVSPNINFYPEFDSRKLGNFKTTAEIGKALLIKHNIVHSTVGGLLNNIREAPKAPIFWPFHAFIDDIWSEWEELTVKVPSLLGLSYYQAYKVLVGSNLRPGKVSYESRWRWLFGRINRTSASVTSQHPLPGQHGLRGSTVDLVLR